MSWMSWLKMVNSYSVSDSINDFNTLSKHPLCWYSSTNDKNMTMFFFLKLKNKAFLYSNFFRCLSY